MWLNLLLPPLHLFSFLSLFSSSYPPRKVIVVGTTIITSNSFSSSFSTFSNSCNRYLPPCHQRSFTSSMFLHVTSMPPCHYWATIMPPLIPPSPPHSPPSLPFSFSSSFHLSFLKYKILNHSRENFVTQIFDGFNEKDTVHDYKNKLLTKIFINSTNRNLLMYLSNRFYW